LLKRLGVFSTDGSARKKSIKINATAPEINFKTNI
jgi:hypothetical protein